MSKRKRGLTLNTSSHCSMHEMVIHTSVHLSKSKIQSFSDGTKLCFVYFLRSLSLIDNKCRHKSVSNINVAVNSESRSRCIFMMNNIKLQISSKV